MKKGVFIVALLAALASQAFPPIPRESAKELRVTKGKPFSEGLVFVNGRFLRPPYVVERWGTGIRINKIQVTGQIIDWNEFLKTQEGVTATAVEAPPAPPPAPASADSPAAPSAPPPPPPPSDGGDSASLDDLFGAVEESPTLVIVERTVGASAIESLDDLFDDDVAGDAGSSEEPEAPSDEKTPRERPKPRPKKSEPPKPRTRLVLKGSFVKNESVRAYVKTINAARAEIDRTLRAGGLICFGDRYSRIVGDAHAADRVLSVLPELQKSAESAEQFRADVRAAGLFYLHEAVCDDLFACRIDYRAMQEYREKLRKDREWKKMMDTKKPIF